jgi:hypothetical protein
VAYVATAGSGVCQTDLGVQICAYTNVRKVLQYNIKRTHRLDRLDRHCHGSPDMPTGDINQQ